MASAFFLKRSGEANLTRDSPVISLSRFLDQAVFDRPLLGDNRRSFYWLKTSILFEPHQFQQ